MIREMLQKAGELPLPTAKRLKPNVLWPEQHARRLEQLGRPWWVSGLPTESDFMLYPGLKMLSARQLDLLAVLGFEYPDAGNRLCDVSLSGKFASSRCRISTAVTPGSELYIGLRCRLRHGREALAQQSIHYGPRQDRLKAYSSAFLHELAGNAFESMCCSAMVLTKTVLQAHLSARASQRIPRSLMPGDTTATQSSSRPRWHRMRSLEAGLDFHANWRRRSHSLEVLVFDVDDDIE